MSDKLPDILLSARREAVYKSGFTLDHFDFKETIEIVDKLQSRISELEQQLAQEREWKINER